MVFFLALPPVHCGQFDGVGSSQQLSASIRSGQKLIRLIRVQVISRKCLGKSLHFVSNRSTSLWLFNAVTQKQKVTLWQCFAFSQIRNLVTLIFGATVPMGTVWNVLTRARRASDFGLYSRNCIHPILVEAISQQNLWRELTEMWQKPFLP